MHARDAHEVRHTGDGKNIPVTCRDRLLLPHHQTREHTRVSRIGNRRLDGSTNLIACPIDSRCWATRDASQNGGVTRHLSDLGRDLNALLEKPCLEIEAKPVAGSNRMSNPRMDLPLLTWRQRRRWPIGCDWPRDHEAGVAAEVSRLKTPGRTDPIMKLWEVFDLNMQRNHLSILVGCEAILKDELRTPGAPASSQA